MKWPELSLLEVLPPELRTQLTRERLQLLA